MNKDINDMEENYKNKEVTKEVDQNLAGKNSTENDNLEKEMESQGTSNENEQLSINQNTDVESTTNHGMDVANPDEATRNEDEHISNENNGSTLLSNDKAGEPSNQNKDGGTHNEVMETVVDGKVNEITDEYHYTKSGEYTSEMFKVVVQNIPSRVSYGHLREKLKEILGFLPKKLKYNPHNCYAFCAFQDEKQRLEAIEKLNNYEWKGHTFLCKKAGPAKDPLIRENKRRANDAQYQSKKMKYDALAGNTPEEKLVHVVCPYAQYSYEEQVKMKETAMQEYIGKLTEKMRINGCGKQWINKREDKQCLELLPIITSPVQTNFRNKVEFTIGFGPDEKDNTVGFRLGSYREGNLTIVEATHCLHCTKTSVDLAKEAQTFLQSLPYSSYNLTNHTGLWQQMTVRTCTTGDVMAILQISSHHLGEDDLEELKKKIIEYFSSDDRQVKVTSLYLSSSSQKNNNIDTFVHLHGNEHVQEKLHGLTFRISPNAFFQVNTPGAELLYGKVKEWCDLDQDDSCVLDVCCGTGTIGLFIAKGADLPVVGVEISEQAVDDARFNAGINGIENAKFVCGPAEQVLDEEIKKLKKKNVIAVVDPPRAGLHKRVLHLLRSCNAIKKIVYVSCSPKQAAENFIGLCRAESKRYRGKPFRTVRAVPVDLFPQTPHCELIVELERLSDGTT